MYLIMKDIRNIGYARVSTKDQRFDAQVAQLIKAGVRDDHIYREHASGAKMTRQALSRALRAIRPGDTLVVTKLDRLARSLKGLIEISEYLDKEGANLRVLDGAIDTTTPGGRLVFHVLGSIAEFERALTSERTKIVMKHKMDNEDWVPGPDGAIGGSPLKIKKWLELEADGKVVREGRDPMKARLVVDILNAADPDGKQIGHPNTYRQWKKKGFRGLDPIEEFGEEPLQLEKD